MSHLCTRPCARTSIRELSFHSFTSKDYGFKDEIGKCIRSARFNVQRSSIMKLCFPHCGTGWNSLLLDFQPKLAFNLVCWVGTCLTELGLMGPGMGVACLFVIQGMGCWDLPL